jgi:molybdenum cofactor cytidylyltransferase
VTAGGVILLAAGASRRFGSDKRRHVLADGTSLLLASLTRYRAAFAATLVVLRPEDDDLAERIAAAAAPPTQGAVSVIRCADAHLGMGHSLACGVRAAPADWRYLFVALADMAWIEPATLIRLRRTQENAPPDAVVQPEYQGRPGHPVGFSAAWFARLGALQGDQGARPRVADAGAARIAVAVADPGVLQDLDRPN